MESHAAESTLTGTLQLDLETLLDLLTRLVQRVNHISYLFTNIENFKLFKIIAYHGAAAFSEPESAALRVSTLMQ